MSNTYSPCGGFIIDPTGKEWPVETAHPLPLPKGIVPVYDKKFYSILFSTTEAWDARSLPESTHWLARRPLPEVPRVKTQEEKDMEVCIEEWGDARQTEAFFAFKSGFFRGLNHARQCPAKPAA